MEKNQSLKEVKGIKTCPLVGLAFMVDVFGAGWPEVNMHRRMDKKSK